MLELIDTSLECTTLEHFPIFQIFLQRAQLYFSENFCSIYVLYDPTRFQSDSDQDFEMAIWFIRFDKAGCISYVSCSMWWGIIMLEDEGCIFFTITFLYGWEQILIQRCAVLSSIHCAFNNCQFPNTCCCDAPPNHHWRTIHENWLEEMRNILLWWLSPNSLPSAVAVVESETTLIGKDDIFQIFDTPSKGWQPWPKPIYNGDWWG